MELIITFKIEVESVFSPSKFALYSVQKNFMASKSFKVEFSMNIKMMLFHQFVTLLHLDFLLLFALISSNVKYALLLQNCQSQTQSRVVSPFFFPVFFIRGKF